MDFVVSRSPVEQKFFELCGRVVAENELELYDLEYISHSMTLRLYIQNKETKTALIEDCVKIDRALDPFIESLEWMPAELILEVSSPGIYRQLKTKEHFANAVGADIALALNKKLGELVGAAKAGALASERKLVAKLLECVEDSINIGLNSEVMNIKFENIKKANIEVAINDI